MLLYHTVFDEPHLMHSSQDGLGTAMSCI